MRAAHPRRTISQCTLFRKADADLDHRRLHIGSISAPAREPAEWTLARAPARRPSSATAICAPGSPPSRLTNTTSRSSFREAILGSGLAAALAVTTLLADDGLPPGG